VFAHGIIWRRRRSTEKCKSENDCNFDMVSSWQHLCQNFDVSAEVALNNFIGVDSDVIVVQW
jgi:hypothetical protein